MTAIACQATADCQNVAKGLPKDRRMIAEGLPKNQQTLTDCQTNAKRVPKCLEAKGQPFDCQMTAEKLPKDCQTCQRTAKDC
ncbi:hypothetical protein FA10DRAFT_269200 [Acaromyces ingoldii]|uniref:Uncharacterized protein n=1 Tax=Acaromyces ingoldii TaxID=215250 RepID=A0A316YGF5_9BASI|nr:hypothetical protein FA10DRAFT_269200 [Acaromyces ingoldii]PWN87924.1 hypothetical protein FA10DRAFT_269200 [Acaromyces ingoldii]